VEIHGTAGQATDGTIIWRMRIARWIPKSTMNTHSDHIIITALPLQQLLQNMPQYHVIRTLPVLFCLCPSDVTHSWYEVKV
jgi:hypothetical protein